MRKRSASTATGRSLDVTVGCSPARNVPMTCYLDKSSHRKRRLNQYLKGDRIGKGRHGEVFICRDTDHDHEVVGLALVVPSAHCCMPAWRLAAAGIMFRVTDFELIIAGPSSFGYLGDQDCETKQSKGQDQATAAELSANGWVDETGAQQYGEQCPEGNCRHEAATPPEPGGVAGGD